MSRIRVLWAIKQLGPGGSEHLLYAAAARHDFERFTIETTYMMRGNDELVDDLTSLGVAVDCLGVTTEFDLRWIERLRTRIVDGRYDIVHVHSPLIAGVIRPVLATIDRARRPALVITEHGAWRHYHPLTRLLNLVSIPVGAAHLAVSESTRDSMPRWLRRRTDVVIHGTLSAELAPAVAERSEVRHELGVSDDEVLVLTVANLRPEKDYPTLLRAAERVVGESANVRFIAAGGGELELQLRSRHRRTGLGWRFQFLGFRADATRLMAAADMFLLPSKEEGGPLAISEAMALGLPIIATRAGGVPNAVRDQQEGLLVPIGDADAMAAAVLRLVREPELRARLAAGAKARSASFDIGGTVASIEALYERAATQRGHRRRVDTDAAV